MSQSPEKPLSPEQLEAAAGGLRLTGDILRPQDSGGDSQLSVEQLKKAQGGLRLTGDVVRPPNSGGDDSQLSVEQLKKAQGGTIIPVRPASRERSEGGGLE